MKTVIALSYTKGKPIGFAIFDLSGRLIKRFGVKAFEKEKLFNYLRSFGSPACVVVEKEKIPKLAKEIARAFGIPALAPKKDLSESEIHELTKSYTYKNPYEKHAIAAGLYLFSKYREIFREIDEILQNMGLEEHADRAKELVLLGKASTPFQAIESAIDFSLLKKKEKETGKKFKSVLEKEDWKEKYENAVNYIKKLEEKIRELEEENKFLLSKAPEKDVELVERVKALEKELMLLKEELQREKELRKKAEEKLYLVEEEKYIEKQGLIPVVRIKDFSHESISELKNTVRIFKRPVLVECSEEDEKAARYLAKLHPLLVIGDFPEKIKAIFIKAGIPVITKAEIEEKITKFKKLAGVERDFLKEFLESRKKKSFLEWLEMYRKRFL